MAIAVLDDAITLSEMCLLAIVHLEPDFSRQNHADIDRVGLVHPRILKIHHLNSAGKLLVHLCDRRFEIKVRGGGRLVGPEFRHREANSLASRPSAIVVAIAMALVLGGAVGYNLKPETVAGAPGHPNVGNGGQLEGAGDACIWFGQHKAC